VKHLDHYLEADNSGCLVDTARRRAFKKCSWCRRQ